MDISGGRERAKRDAVINLSRFKEGGNFFATVVLTGIFPVGRVLIGAIGLKRLSKEQTLDDA